MPSRRRFLSWMIATPLAAALGAGPAAALPAAGTILDGKTRARLRVVKRAVFSISNANDRYVAVAELAREPHRAPLLAMPGGTISASGWGTGYGTGGGSVDFQVDRAAADVIAAAWRVTHNDRVPLGAGLVGRWRATSQPFTAGAAMELLLDVENTGPDTVHFSIGGRQRGPRDNRFSFDVTHDARPLPILEAHDFGGLMYYQALAPGEVRTLTVDLARWVKLDRPGVYDLVCRYSAELVPSPQSPQWPDRGHETWDLTLTAPLTISVR